MTLFTQLMAKVVLIALSKQSRITAAKKSLSAPKKFPTNLQYANVLFGFSKLQRPYCIDKMRVLITICALRPVVWQKEYNYRRTTKIQNG